MHIALCHLADDANMYIFFPVLKVCKVVGTDNSEKEVFG